MSSKQLKWHGANYIGMNLFLSFVQIGIENSTKLLQSDMDKSVVNENGRHRGIA